jgi:hypothetical protein
VVPAPITENRTLAEQMHAYSLDFARTLVASSAASGDDGHGHAGRSRQHDDAPPRRSIARGSSSSSHSATGMVPLCVCVRLRKEGGAEECPSVVANGCVVNTMHHVIELCGAGGRDRAGSSHAEAQTPIPHSSSHMFSPSYVRDYDAKRTLSSRAQTHTRTHAHTHTRTHAHTHTRTRTHAYIHTRIHAHAHAHKRLSFIHVFAPVLPL